MKMMGYGYHPCCAGERCLQEIGVSMQHGFAFSHRDGAGLKVGDITYFNAVLEFLLLNGLISYQ